MLHEFLPSCKRVRSLVATRKKLRNFRSFHVSRGRFRATVAAQPRIAQDEPCRTISPPVDLARSGSVLLAPRPESSRTRLWGNSSLGRRGSYLQPTFSVDAIFPAPGKRCTAKGPSPGILPVPHHPPGRHPDRCRGLRSGERGPEAEAGQRTAPARGGRPSNGSQCPVTHGAAAAPVPYSHFPPVSGATWCPRFAR